jgi:hypothetical protein
MKPVVTMDQCFREADGCRLKWINEAEGDAARFSALLAEYIKAPEVTRRRICLETLESVLPGIRSKIIIDKRSAQSRLDDILGSETHNAVAKHELIEIIRTTKERILLRDTFLTDAEKDLDMGALVPIRKGCQIVEQEIFAAAAEKVQVFGIELLDIRFKRINHNGGEYTACIVNRQRSIQVPERHES